MSFLVNPYIYDTGCPTCTGDRVNLFGYGYFPLDGNANGNLTTGTTNAVTWSDSFLSTNFGSAATFSPSTSYINCGSDTVYGGSGSSISCFVWVNFNGFAVELNPHIGGRKQSSTVGWRFLFQHDVPNNIFLFVQTGNVNNFYSVPMFSGTPTHIGFTYDNNTVRYYVNGSEVGTSAPGAKTIAATGNLFISSNPLSTANGHFDGDMDDFVIFNRALTPTEVSNIYDGGLPCACPLSV